MKQEGSRIGSGGGWGDCAYFDRCQNLLQLILWHVDKLASTLIAGCKADEVKGCEAGLAPGRDENQDWLEGAVRLDGSVGWLVHGGHAGAVEAASVPLDVALQWDRPHAWLEIEETLQANIAEHDQSASDTPERHCCMDCGKDAKRSKVWSQKRWNFLW